MLEIYLKVNEHKKLNFNIITLVKFIKRFILVLHCLIWGRRGLGSPGKWGACYVGRGGKGR